MKLPTKSLLALPLTPPLPRKGGGRFRCQGRVGEFYCTFLIQPNLSAILPVWIPVRVS